MTRRNGPKNRKILLFTLTLVMGLTFTTLNQEFLTPHNFLTVAQQTMLYALCAAGTLFPLLTGEVDFSTGFIFSVSGLTVCCAYALGAGTVSAVACALAAGMLLGAFNGFLVSVLRIPSYLATLASVNLFRALAHGLANMTANAGYFDLSRAFPETLSTVLAFPDGLRILLSVTFLILLLAHIALTRTPWGLHLYATGGAEQTAVLAGVHTGRVKFTAFVLCGFFAATAGIAAAGSLGTVDAVSGMGYETDALTAAVMGGVCLTGAQGSIPGIVFGALALAVLKSGLVVIQAGSLWQYAADGILLILFTGIPSAVHTLSAVVNRPKK